MSAENHHFGGPWVRIQAWTENVSLIFFWADFSTFSYLNCFSHNLGGLHKPCGPSKTRGKGLIDWNKSVWCVGGFFYLDRDFQNITSIQGVLELSSFDQCGFFLKFFFENLRNVIFCYNIKSSSQNLQLQNRLREHTSSFYGHWII